VSFSRSDTGRSETNRRRFHARSNRGDDAHLDILKTALTSDEWKIGTAEALFHDENAELHVDVTNTERSVRDEQDSRTVVGVDLNEDNVALAALSEDGVDW